jgi:rod shape-determining protein MreC
VFDPNSLELLPPDRPPDPETPERVQAFVSRHRAFFVLLTVLVAQLLLLSVQITRSQRVRLIQVWAVAVFDPFERALRTVTDAGSSAWNTYRDLWGAHEQNRELRVQLVAASSRLQQLSEAAQEAQRLREILAFKNRLPLETVAAEVIASSPGESSKSIYIDKGKDFALTPDLAVMTPAGIVGKTLQVFPHTAQVLLITDPSSGAAAVFEHSRVQGILKGASLNACQVEYVMNEAPVALGERILTSGLDQIYPKGFILGRVVETAEGNIYKKVRVKPEVSLDRLEMVLVVLKPPSQEYQARIEPKRH